jgi:hypothetical protein
MMNMPTRRLLNAALIVIAAVSTPVAAFAQDVAMSGDNASNWIGGLVVWLLPAGGILAVVVATAMDKTAQAGRTARR